MAKYTFKSVSITSAAGTSSGQDITYSTLDSSPGASEGRTIGTLTVVPDVKVHPFERVWMTVTAVTTSQFTVRSSGYEDAEVTFPVLANITVETFEQVSSVSNAKSAAVSEVRRILDITGAAEILTDSQISEQIDAAVQQYSVDMARTKRHEVQGNGEHEYALPSDWIEHESVIRHIEYPGGGQEPDYVDENEYYVEIADATQRTIDNASAAATSVTTSTATEAGFFRDGELVRVGDDDATETNWVSSDGNTTTGVVALKNALANTYDASPYIRKLDHIKFIATSPESSDYFVVEYTLPQSHTDSLDSVPTSHQKALYHLSSAYSARSIAASFAKSTSGMYDADQIDQLAKVEAWHSVANEQEKIYNRKLKIGEEPKKPVIKFIDTDSHFSWGRDFLFHPRRFR